MKILRKRWIIKGLVSTGAGPMRGYLGEEHWYGDSTLAKLHTSAEADGIRSMCHPFRGSLCATGIGGATYIQHIEFIEVTLGATP